MEYHIVLQHDPDSGHVLGRVLELPNIIVDGRDEDDAFRMTRDAIDFYLEERPDEAPLHTVVRTVQVGACASRATSTAGGS